VENDGKMTIFSAAQEFLGFLPPLAQENAWLPPLPRTRLRLSGRVRVNRGDSRPRFTLPSAPIQANPAAA
jgi:hypothetical protein